MRHVLGMCVALGLLVLSGCTYSKQGYLDRGNKLFDAGKYDDAILNYRKAIQKDPEYGEAYYRLGLAAMKAEHGRDAYDALLRAVQLRPDDTDAKEKFGDICLSFYLQDPSHPQLFYTEITQISSELLAKDPASYKGLVLKGYLASTDKKPKDAIVLFRKALQINSADPGVTTELVQLLVEDGQSQEAERLAKDLIARDKTYGPVYNVLYALYTSTGRPADAEAILKTKVSNNPKHADYILQLAAHYARLQKQQESNAAVERILSNPKDFPQARMLVGDFYLGLKNYDTAIHYYQEGAASANAKDRVVYQKRTVAALVNQGKHQEAARAVQEILRDNPNDEEALHLHADLMLATQRRQNADAALREFQVLVDKNPQDASLRVQLSRSYRLRGDLDGARAQLQEALKIRPNFLAANYEIAEISLLQLRLSEALQLTKTILAAKPNDRRARLLRARALVGTGDLATARTELTQLIKESPQDTDPRLQLGLLSLSEKKYEEADDILSKLRQTGEPRVIAALGTAYTFERKFDKALEVLKEGLKNSPDSLTLVSQLADTAALAGDYDLAIKNYQKVLTLDPRSLLAQRRLAEVYELKGDRGNAILVYEQAQQLAPNDLTISLLFADALSQAGRTKEAKVQYENIVKKHPDNASALNNAAFFLSDSGGDLNEALRLAQRALEKVPEQPGFSDTIGYIYMKKGLNDSAIQTFSNLVRKYPRYATFRYHLGMALLEKGDKAGARRELQTALGDHPSRRDERKIKELLDKMS